MDCQETGLNRWAGTRLMSSPPIVVALLFQLAALVLVALFLYGLLRLSGMRLTLAQVVALHGLVVLCMTRCSRLDWWWSVIQPVLPLTMLFMAGIDIPSWCYLFVFLVLLFSYWSIFRTRVPYFPSTHSVWVAMDDLLPKGKPLSFIDIGSGMGGLVLHLANVRPESRFDGIEIAPLPWLISRFRAWKSHAPVRFMRGNYEGLDFSGFDVIFAYLSPAAMPALWLKVQREMKKGSIFVSYEFPIPQVDADLCIYPEKTVINNATIFIWRI